VMSTIDDDDDLLTAGLKVLGGLAVSAGTGIATNLYTTSKNFEAEFRADAFAGRITGKPWALASVFEKMMRPPGNGELPAEMAQLYFTPPLACAIGVRTHPDSEDRVRRMREMPAEQPEEESAGGVEFCAQCGAHAMSGQRRCTECGKAVDPALSVARECPSCAAPREGDAAFCTRCGARYV